MSDEKFKNFLQQNATPIPEAPLGESSRVWRNIEARGRKRSWWLVFAPLVAASLIAVVFFQVQSYRAEIQAEEEYLQSEWSSMMLDVNSDFEPELITSFEK